MSPLSVTHMGDPRNLEKMICHAFSTAGTVSHSILRAGRMHLPQWWPALPSWTWEASLVEIGVHGLLLGSTQHMSTKVWRNGLFHVLSAAITNHHRPGSW